MTIHWLTTVWQIALLVIFGGIITAYFRGQRVAAAAVALTGEPPLYVATRWRKFLFVLSFIVLAIATITPFHYIATELFLLRVLQHLLIIAVSSSLFWASNPMPMIWRGLPAGWQKTTAWIISPDRSFHGKLQFISGRGVAWFTYVAVIWVFYDPPIHAISRVFEPLHVLEVSLMMVGGYFFWWHIVGAAPNLHKPLPVVVQAIYALFGSWPFKFIGASVIFSDRVLHTYPADLLAKWGVTAIQNELYGGGLIWLIGGVAYTTAAGLWLQRWISKEEDKPALSIEDWAGRGKMLMPGVEER